MRHIGRSKMHKNDIWTFITCGLLTLLYEFFIELMLRAIYGSICKHLLLSKFLIISDFWGHFKSYACSFTGPKILSLVFGPIDQMKKTRAKITSE